MAGKSLNFSSMTTGRSWLLLVSVIWLAVNLVSCQEKFSKKQLEGMTDAELEAICVKRGFELVKDDVHPETGEPLVVSHEDYVESAQRCLAIEEEMNELLDTYPELAEELDAEVRKMEEEQAQKKAEVAKLQKQQQEAEEQRSKEKSSGGAFLTGRTADGGSGSDDKKSSTGKKEESTKQKRSGSSDSKTDTASSQAIAGTPDDQDKDDYTLRVLAVEIIRGFLEHAENDLKRIVELMAPVIRPILEAGNSAWKTLKAVLMSFTDGFEKSQERRADEAADAKETTSA